MYVRGPSAQEVSALYRETFDGVSRLSKSTVSRVTQQLNQNARYGGRYTFTGPDRLAIVLVGTPDGREGWNQS